MNKVKKMHFTERKKLNLWMKNLKEKIKRILKKNRRITLLKTISMLRTIMTGKSCLQFINKSLKRISKKRVASLILSIISSLTWISLQRNQKLEELCLEMRRNNSNHTKRSSSNLTLLNLFSLLTSVTKNKLNNKISRE